MKKKKPNPYLIDDDNPELTEEFFANARPAIEVLEEQFGKAAVKKFLKARGRPRKAAPKIQMTFRFDPDIIETFRATGRGWQSRVNQVLREWVSSHNV